MSKGLQTPTVDVSWYVLCIEPAPEACCSGSPVVQLFLVSHICVLLYSVLSPSMSLQILISKSELCLKELNGLGQ